MDEDSLVEFLEVNLRSHKHKNDNITVLANKTMDYKREAEKYKKLYNEVKTNGGKTINVSNRIKELMEETVKQFNVS